MFPDKLKIWNTEEVTWFKGDSIRKPWWKKHKCRKWEYFSKEKKVH